MQPASSRTHWSVSRANQRRTIIPVFLYFLAAGVPTVMLGPILPALIQRWHIQDAQAGTLFTASFIGQFSGAWFATRNLRASVLYGSAITAVGCAAMAWVGFGAAHLTLFTIGLGLGAGLTAGNVIAGTVVPTARARMIAALNAAWGVGAITCPLLVRLSSTNGIRSFFLATASLVAVASLLTVIIPQTKQAKKSTEISQQSSRSQETKARPGMPLPPVPLVIFAAAIFLYIGVENSLGGWLPSYANRTSPSLRPSTISFYFWIAELFGRILMTALMYLFGEAVLYRLCLAVLIVTEILLCSIAHISSAGVITLTVLAALSLAPLYPLIVSFLIARAGNHARLGALFACASIGGATLPWLTGVVSTYFNGLRTGLLVPTSGSILLFCLSVAVTAYPNPTTET